MGLLLLLNNKFLYLNCNKKICLGEEVSKHVASTLKTICSEEKNTLTTYGWNEQNFNSASSTPKT